MCSLKFKYLLYEKIKEYIRVICKTAVNNNVTVKSFVQFIVWREQNLKTKGLNEQCLVYPFISEFRIYITINFL